MKAILLFIFFLSSSAVWAQSNMVSSGGTAAGTTGTSTFSIGQVVYHNNRNNAFSAAEGVQQPFEIIPLAVQEIEAINLYLKIYPNPTFSGFYISLPITETENPAYELSDTSGKIIQQGTINTLETFVATDNLTSGVYILKISKASNSYRSYKIIKQ
ncbi:MAG TPA: T9SS type A sorting domain-containing protein [Flavobacterium sp.]|nr:T9SS type A sorting domain-containing protein [Flavobacterium sp.]